MAKNQLIRNSWIIFPDSVSNHESRIALFLDFDSNQRFKNQLFWIFVSNQRVKNHLFCVTISGRESWSNWFFDSLPISEGKWYFLDMLLAGKLSWSTWLRKFSLAKLSVDIEAVDFIFSVHDLTLLTLRPSNECCFYSTC